MKYIIKLPGKFSTEQIFSAFEQVIESLALEGMRTKIWRWGEYPYAYDIKTGTKVFKRAVQFDFYFLRKSFLSRKRMVQDDFHTFSLHLSSIVGSEVEEAEYKLDASLSCSMGRVLIAEKIFDDVLKTFGEKVLAT